MDPVHTFPERYVNDYGQVHMPLKWLECLLNVLLTPSLYCMGPKVSEHKKWLVPNFILKGWEWCI